MTQPSEKTNPSGRSVALEAWTLADLVDLEILVGEDADLEHARPGCHRDRDRGIHNQFAARFAGQALETRRRLFQFWLGVRRRDRFRGQPSPGEEIVSIVFWIRVALFVAGILVARGAVWSFFRGAEITAARPEPINILWFWLACIALPALLTLYGFWVFLGQRAAPKLPAAPPFLRGALFRLIQPLLRNAASQVFENLGAENRLNAQAAIGVLKQRVESRRSAIGAAIFHLVQAFGIGFTAGVLVFSWVECEFHSRVFGWQTTDQEMTAASVHRWTEILATPWSWLKPESVGYPTLTQVEQTKFIRYQDAAGLPPGAAPVWAAFLLWSAFVYGLAPRIVLERLSRAQVNAILKKETFEELRFDSLWERMTLQRGTFVTPATEVPAEAMAPARAAATPDTHTASSQLIFPAEIHNPESVSAIEQWLKVQKGWDVSTVIVLRPGLPEKEQLIAKLREGGSEQKVLIMQESFMPPVQQFLEFLKNMRAAIGAKNGILVGLIGKPDGTPFARPPKTDEFDVWRKKIATLGDPNVDVISFVPPE